MVSRRCTSLCQRYATAGIAGRPKGRPYRSKPHRGASLMSRHVSKKFSVFSVQFQATATARGLEELATVVAVADSDANFQPRS